MPVEKDALRDWHRLFGLLLTDYFTGSPFTVEVKRDLSQQQQFLDVVILRRGRGRFVGRLPDGLDGLVAHNLITFKSHPEALDGWAMKEFIGHYVAYRKLVSPSVSELLPEDQFRLFAVCARIPQNLSGQIPWQEVQAGVYDCQWRFEKEGFAMSYTMEDFKRDYIKEHFAKLTPEKQQEILESLPLERRLAGASLEQIRAYLDQLTAAHPAERRKPRRKR